MNLKSSRFGFSLVEVTVAIGIVSFALLAVVALLPTGLQSIKNATEQAAATATLNAISEALRHAESEDGTAYRFYFEGEQDFALGGTSPSAWLWDDLTLEGIGDSTNRRLVARLEIVELPSIDQLRPGVAQVSVAWSAQRNPEFDAASNRWRNSEGSVASVVHFLPSARP